MNGYYNSSLDTLYEDPDFSRYTDLNSCAGSRSQYDELKHEPKKNSKVTVSKRPLSKRTKVCVTFIVVTICMCTLSSILTYIFLENRTKGGHSTEIGRQSGKQADFRISVIRTTCPGGWSTFGNMCYREFTDSKTWTQANDHCLSMGADLVSIHNQNETNFLRQQFSLTSNKIWIGLNDKNNEGQFVWSDESSFYFNNWKTDEPNNFNNNEHCVHLCPLLPGKWNDNNCFMSFRYICKQRRESRCGQGPWLFFEESCYWFSPTNGRLNSSSWSGARQICQNNGADLVKIETDNEYSFLLSQATRSSANVVWIGLNDLDQSGVYRWTDGSVPTFLTWNINEPDGGVEHCTGISSKFGNWQDEVCEKFNGYICEKQL